MSISIDTAPPRWSSAHAKCEVKFKLDGLAYSSVSASSPDGYAVLNHASDTRFNGLAGSYVYVYSASGQYKGRFMIFAANSTTLTIETDYIATDTGSVALVEEPVITLFGGYTSTEDGYDFIPEETLSNIKLRLDTDGYFTLRVDGYLKTLFKKVYPPVQGFDYNLSAPWRMEIESTPIGSTYYVVNGALVPENNRNPFDSSYGLEEYYGSEGWLLIPNHQDYISFSGSGCVTIFSRIIDNPNSVAFNVENAIYNTFIYS